MIDFDHKNSVKYINLWVVFIASYTYCKYGWIRLFKTGWGIMWKPAKARMIFSERNGYHKTYIIGNYRFKILKPSKY